jgi:sugar phosphate isomerase/epimerase
MLLATKGPIITELGRGDIDYFGVIKELDELNYDGWITIELDAPTLVPKLSLGRCLSHVNELLRLVEPKNNLNCI